MSLCSDIRLSMFRRALRETPALQSRDRSIATPVGEMEARWIQQLPTFAGLLSLFLLLLVSGRGVSAAWAEPTVTGVAVEGNVRVDEGTVLLQVKTAAGGPYEAARIQEDLKNVYRTGFFEQVTVRTVPDPSGRGIQVIFVVREKRALRKTAVNGNSEVKADTIIEKMNLGSRAFADRGKISRGIDAVKAYYESQGYYGTQVSYKLEPVGENQSDLTLEVKEGDKRRIREVAFEGNRKVDADTLEDLIETESYSWWSSWLLGTGSVKEEQIQNDLRELTKYYLNHGFVDAKVTGPDIQEIKNGLRVVFKIEEGEVYKIGDITAGGDLIRGKQDATLEGIESKAGEVFNLEQLRKDTFHISEKYTDTGYAFANVEPETQIDREGRKVNVNFVANKGQRIQVNRILISGNKKTRDNVIRRSLQIQEQELFSSSKIRRSQELLQRLGYFDEVTITPEPSETSNQVDLLVNVREGSTGSFSAGAGFSSGDGLILSTRIAENNLFGYGHSLALDLNTGTRRDNYSLSYTNPRVNDSRWSFGTEALATEREYDDFDRVQRGGSVTVGYPLWFLGEEYLDDVRFSVSYELMAIKIDDVEDLAPDLVKQQAGSTTSSSFTPQLVRNTIDNPLDPTSGSRQSVSVELAGAGGDQEFYLVQAANTLYYPLAKLSWGNFIFSQRTRVGYGETFDNKDFPLFERFFPGGINSVRGFEARELGPKDERGHEYGGNKQLILNFELIFPILSEVGLSGVTFYDVGNAFDDDESIDVGGLRHAVGWGIRWRSPLAPIRLEFGYPLDKEEGDKSFVTNFSLGAPQ